MEYGSTSGNLRFWAKNLAGHNVLFRAVYIIMFSRCEVNYDSGKYGWVINRDWEICTKKSQNTHANMLLRCYKYAK